MGNGALLFVRQPRHGAVHFAPRWTTLPLSRSLNVVQDAVWARLSRSWTTLPLPRSLNVVQEWVWGVVGRHAEERGGFRLALGALFVAASQRMAHRAEGRLAPR